MNIAIHNIFIDYTQAFDSIESLDIRLFKTL
jgi:hypothetical protein